MLERIAISRDVQLRFTKAQVTDAVPLVDAVMWIFLMSSNSSYSRCVILSLLEETTEYTSSVGIGG